MFDTSFLNHVGLLVIKIKGPLTCPYILLTCLYSPLTCPYKFPILFLQSPNLSLYSLHLSLQSPNLSLKSPNLFLQSPTCPYSPLTCSYSPLTCSQSPNLPLQSPNLFLQSPNLSLQSPNLSLQSPNLSLQSPNLVHLTIFLLLMTLCQKMMFSIGTQSRGNNWQPRAIITVHFHTWSQQRERTVHGKELRVEMCIVLQFVNQHSRIFRLHENIKLSFIIVFSKSLLSIHFVKFSL